MSASGKTRAIVTLVVATGGFALALALRERIDPWRATALAAAVAIALSVWTLGPRLRELCAITPRGALGAIAVGVALVAATHVAFRIVLVASPDLAITIRDLYASIEVGAPRLTLVGLTTVVVIGEELVWRGVAIEVLAGRRPPLHVAAISVALYVLPQLAGAAPLLIVAAFGLGSLFAAQRLITGRLADPLLTHAIWSIAVFVVLPLA